MYIPTGIIKSQLDGKEYPHFMDVREFFPETTDALIVLIWAVGLTLLRVAAQKYFQQIAASLNVGEHETNKTKIHDIRNKFSEACWKTSFYTISWLGCLILVNRQGIWEDTSLCWKGWPYVPLETETYHYYMFQLGFYFHSLFAHFAYEVRRKDFYPLLFHHIVTIGLIYGSYVCGFHRIGLLVLLCHDINDIIFELGKTYVYRKKEPHTTVTFVMILISWVVSRLYFYPLKVIRSSYFESTESAPIDIFPFHKTFNGSLTFLLCLHIYWFYLMIQMAIRFVSGDVKGIEDSREDEKAPATNHKEQRTTKKKM